MSPVSRDDREGLSAAERQAWAQIHLAALIALDTARVYGHHTAAFAAFDIALQAEHVLGDRGYETWAAQEGETPEGG